MQAKKRKPTLSDLVVLSLLSEEPMHGYHLVSQLEIRDAKDWAPVSKPQVYYSIHKLLELGLIKPTNSDTPSLGPERVQYEITSKGKKVLDEALASEEWATGRQPPPFLTWMALSSNLSKRDTLFVIRKRQEFLEREVERERKTLRDVESDAGPMNQAARLMITFTLEMFEAELRWLTQVASSLGASRVSN